MSEYQINEDIAFKGGCIGFGVNTTKGDGVGETGYKVAVYIEDDGAYFEKMSFHSFWLDDLIEQATRAKALIDSLEKEARRRRSEY